jgi:exosome complex exonuclease DIS3/RRP44
LLSVPAIRKTLQYYSEHLLSSAARPPQLVLLTDDKRNRELAHADGMLAVSTRDYVDGLDPKEREKLVDLVVGGVDEIEPGERRGRRLYDEVNQMRQRSFLPLLMTRSTSPWTCSLPE